MMCWQCQASHAHSWVGRQSALVTWHCLGAAHDAPADFALHVHGQPASLLMRVDPWLQHVCVCMVAAGPADMGLSLGYHVKHNYDLPAMLASSDMEPVYTTVVEVSLAFALAKQYNLKTAVLVQITCLSFPALLLVCMMLQLQLLFSMWCVV